jgi:hypothetical protein
MEQVRIRVANTTALRIPSWRTNLTDAQVAMLNEMLGPHLARFGYATAPP